MRRHVPITVAPNDEFHMYGLELPLDNWSYVLDEPGIVHGPGWYPFHRPLSRSEQYPAAPLLHHAVAKHGYRVAPGAATTVDHEAQLTTIAEQTWRGDPAAAVRVLIPALAHALVTGATPALTVVGDRRAG